MRFLVVAASVVAVAQATAYSPSSTSRTDKLAARALLNLAIYTEKHAFPSRNPCTLANAAKRKEWFVHER